MALKARARAGVIDAGKETFFFASFGKGENMKGSKAPQKCTKKEKKLKEKGRRKESFAKSKDTEKEKIFFRNV